MSEDSFTNQNLRGDRTHVATVHPALNPSAHVDTFARDGLPPLEQWPLFNLTGRFAHPDHLNAATELLDNAVRQGFGDKVAIVARDSGGEWTETSYRSLQQQVDAIASVLTHEMGLVAGNRVLIRGFSGAMLAAAWFATLKAGGVAVTTMPMLRSTELRTVMERADCGFALCDVRLREELESAIGSYDHSVRACWWGADSSDANCLDTLMARHTEPFVAVETSSDDVCLIAFTSGTTGLPKGCMHFHRDVMAMCDAVASQVLHLTAGDRCIGTPPLAFTFGLGALLVFPLYARGSTVLMETVTPETLLEAIGTTLPTVTFTAPTFYRATALVLQREPGRFNTSSLRQSVSAGEALPDATRALWREATGIEMVDGIGATEMMHIFIAAAGAEVRAGAIGKAVPGYEIAVLDDALAPLPAGELGRLAVRGPTGCRYLADPRQTAYVQGGWNLTGDACTMDADGYVHFKARTDDLIISSGYNIGAPEVEAALLTHDGVAECAVVGVADVERGQCVKAFVVLKPTFERSAELARALQDHVKHTIAPYKYPRLVEFVDALPKTETGKLQRFRLKEQA
jgi:2-aminobenzoate-CoA ligase